MEGPEVLSQKKSEISSAAELVWKQIQGPRRDDWWAWADLGLLRMLAGDREGGLAAYDGFARSGARAPDYRSVLDVLEDCQRVLSPADPESAALIGAGIDRLRTTTPL